MELLANTESRVLGMGEAMLFWLLFWLPFSFGWPRFCMASALVGEDEVVPNMVSSFILV